MWVLIVYLLLALTPQECADKYHACKCRYEGGAWKCEGYGPIGGEQK